MHEIAFIASGIRHEFHFPAQWDEVKAHHLVPIATAQAALAAVKDPGKPHDPAPAVVLYRTNLLRQLAGIPTAIISATQDLGDLFFEVDTTDYKSPYKPVPKSEWRLLPQLDWAFTPPVFESSLLPTVQHQGTTWTGPDDRFDSMPLNQWLWAASLNRAMKGAPADKRTALFHQHLACLYTPEGTTWSNITIEQHAASIAHWPPDTQLAALLNYEAIQATLPGLYRRVFDPDGEAVQSPMGVFGLAYDVAKSGVFGTKDRVETVRMHEVLSYMEHTLFQDEQAERKAKANKKPAST